ncbi:hypothetical protein [Microbacterium aoyamense]|uniref:hypothetical protein n=1 Tax=Microbacterium aoyamense TaxID=344166 RepID=UPI0020050046|nr:hypothetical protein [Microbacterium aoyamense]
MSKAAVVVAVIGVTLCSLSATSALVQSFSTDIQIDERQAQVTPAQLDLSAAESVRLDAETVEAVLESSYAARQAVLEARPAFVAAVAAATTAFASAKDKVDVSGHRAAVVTAQDVVRATTTDAKLVQEQSDAVTAIASTVTAEVKAFDERVAAEAAARAAAAVARESRSYDGAVWTGEGAGAGDWFADMRQRLTNVGGGHIELRQFDGSCGGVQSVACAYSTGGIRVAPAIASWSSARKNWAMVHELAHTVHFSRWSAVAASAGYAQLFGSDPELLANCMASARGYTNHGHAGQCTGDRIAWAAQLWNGVVAW